MTRKVKRSPTAVRPEGDIHPTELASHWPVGVLPLVMFGIHGERTVLATALRPLRFTTWATQTWRSLAQGPAGLPRFIGVIPYDEYCPTADRKAVPLLYEIHECLIWESPHKVPRLVRTGTPDSCSLRLSEQALKILWQDAGEADIPTIKPFGLSPTMSDDHYLNQAREVLESIRAGTFYQLNLLRWFRLTNTPSWSEMCGRVSDHGGPCSFLLRHGNTSIASFSPERFVQIEPNTGNPLITTSPIKGTAQRNLTDPNADAKIKEHLAGSAKDLAELHMIVDLMRNDLSRVCLPQSVHVPISDSVATFKHVHHLVAKIQGQLNGDLTMQTIFSKLCPGGSITGAPKMEVMKHIHRLEGRDRGFVMGNAFIMDADGTYDSTILIRTAVSVDGLRSWEYAAGSGIVIKSVPSQELKEIEAKCRPLTQ